MIIEHIQQAIFDTVESMHPGLLAKEAIVVAVPKHKGIGDLASPVAMQLAKLLKTSPLEVAEKIAVELRGHEDIAQVHVAAPGFVNITVTNECLCRSLEALDPSTPVTYGGGKQIILEYAALNVAKHAHIGHIRNIAIGESLHRMFEYLGYNVHTIDHVGDWGTQFGKVLYAVEHWGDKAVIEKDPVGELNDLYVLFHQKSHEDDTLDDQARAISKALEDGDAHYKKLWQWVVDINVGAIDKMLQGMGVHFDDHTGESFYLDKVEDSFAAMEKSGILTHNADGSVAVNFEELGVNLPSCLVQRSDGATLYLTRDIATVEYRLTTYQPERIIYVVGDDQSLHFKQLFAIAKLMKMGEGVEIKHVNYGLVLLPEGKMSTRKGTVVTAEEVLAEAIERAREVAESHGTEHTEKFVQELAYGALNYTMLSGQTHANLTFRWETALSFEGNSAPYLQYVHARTCSLLAKAELVSGKCAGEVSEHERILVIHLSRFEETLIQVCAEYRPNMLCQYLYDLASLFNSLYNTTRILDAGEQDKERLLLITSMVQQTMTKGLELLNIAAPEKM